MYRILSNILSKKNHFSLISVHSFHNDPCFLFMNWFSMHLLYFFPNLLRKNLYKPIFLLLSGPEKPIFYILKPLLKPIVVVVVFYLLKCHPYT